MEIKVEVDYIYRVINKLIIFINSFFLQAVIIITFFYQKIFYDKTSPIIHFQSSNDI